MEHVRWDSFRLPSRIVGVRGPRELFDRSFTRGQKKALLKVVL